MADAYIGEVRMFAGNFAPVGWAFCDGAVLAVADNRDLFSLLGGKTIDQAQTQFRLPDFRARLLIGSGYGSGLTPRSIGQTGGAESVTLTMAQMPSHRHDVTATSNAATTGTAGPDVTFGKVDSEYLFYTDTTKPSSGSATFSPLVIGESGADAAHPNMMPCIAINYIICTMGSYPSQR